jgi:hypothetical protein
MRLLGKVIPSPFLIYEKPTYRVTRSNLLVNNYYYLTFMANFATDKLALKESKKTGVENEFSWKILRH